MLDFIKRLPSNILKSYAYGLYNIYGYIKIPFVIVWLFLRKNGMAQAKDHQEVFYILNVIPVMVLMLVSYIVFHSNIVGHAVIWYMGTLNIDFFYDFGMGGWLLAAIVVPFVAAIKYRSYYLGIFLLAIPFAPLFLLFKAAALMTVVMTFMFLIGSMVLSYIFPFVGTVLGAVVTGFGVYAIFLDSSEVAFLTRSDVAELLSGGYEILMYLVCLVVVALLDLLKCFELDIKGALSR